MNYGQKSFITLASGFILIFNKYWQCQLNGKDQLWRFSGETIDSLSYDWGFESCHWHLERIHGSGREKVDEIST
jgi:hypothetical protein